VAEGISDQDGYYMIVYKHKGKAATYTVKLAGTGCTQTKSALLKGNGYDEVNFSDSMATEDLPAVIMSCTP